jgi:predicted nucleic acid-binding Zn ribbon protein
MGTRTNTEEAAFAVQRALLQCVGPGAAEQLALAQARLAWLETVGEAGLAPTGMSSRLTAVTNGVATIVASEPMLAAELKLRTDQLVAAVNARQRGRPGALYELRGLMVSIRPGDPGPDPGEQPG